MSECEKLTARTEEWNAIYKFMEWLHENHMCIGVWRKKEDLKDPEFQTYLLENPYPYGQPTETLLYRYFDVDATKLEQERRELLRRISEQNK